MKVMRTSKTQRLHDVGRALARALLIVVFLWVPESVTGNCGESAFNLSAFSPITVNLVSRSWIDAGQCLRMAPPKHTNTTLNTTMIGGENPMAIGQVLYRTPVSLQDPRTNNSLSFSTFFAFSLISVVQVPPASNGLAFLITPDQRGLLGSSPGGGAPLFDPGDIILSDTSSHTFAVQIQRSWNHTSSNGPNKNNGRNVTQSPTVNTTSLYSTYLQDAGLNFVWIDYDAERLHLQVTVSNTSDGPKWTMLSTDYDLSGVFLNTTYIGFYSRDKVSINRWSFISAGCPPPVPGVNTVSTPSEPPRPPGLPKLGGIESKGNFTDGKRPHPDPNTKHSWFNQEHIIYISAGGGGAIFVGLLVGAAACKVWLVFKYRGASSVPDRDIPFAPQIFAYRTLSMATNGFDERALLGRGGFGSVYKGLIAEEDSSTLIAVKRIESNNDAQRERQFIAEVASIGRLRHPNLVHLLGWCHEKGELLLVYEYMPNGSLDRLLFGEQENVLPWESRYNIVTGVAEALAFLHGEWEKQVVHRDVKASNVLLDSNFNPRLGDFGLARLIEHNKTSKSGSIAGTLGYLAPELTITGKATDKTDVFSFGALALEVACGRRPIQRTLPPEEVVLVDWVWNLRSQGEMMNAVDPRLPRGQFPLAKVAILLNVGLLCSHPDPGARPSMRQVVRVLKGEVPCPADPNSKPNTAFAAFQRHPSDNYYSPLTMRAPVAFNRPSSNKMSCKTQSRVAPSS